MRRLIFTKTNTENAFSQIAKEIRVFFWLKKINDSKFLKSHSIRAHEYTKIKGIKRTVPMAINLPYSYADEKQSTRHTLNELI